MAIGNKCRSFVNFLILDGLNEQCPNKTKPLLLVQHLLGGTRTHNVCFRPELGAKRNKQKQKKLFRPDCSEKKHRRFVLCALAGCEENRHGNSFQGMGVLSCVLPR